MVIRIRRSDGHTTNGGVVDHPGKSGLTILLLAICCNAVEPYGASVETRRMEEGPSPLLIIPSESASDSDLKSTCTTEAPRMVSIHKSTGDWMFLEDSMDADNSVEDKGLLRDTNTRRLLRKGSDNLGSNLLSVDALAIASMGGNNNAPQSQRIMSTDGSNSLATKEYSTVVMWARPCGCFEGDGNNETKQLVALCPETSDWCSIDGKCYSVGRIDGIARNLWPLLWLWYFTILVAIVCTFQGRIVLDFVKGTILYYFCGCGDRFQNREMRSIDRYNHWVVEEIIDEENLDRQVIRRRRNDGSIASRRMDAIANRSNNSEDGDDEEYQGQGIPPTIVTSRSFPVGEYTNNDTDGEDDETYPAPTLIRRLAQRLRTVVWPWQTSWKRYIKYNLLLRVDLIAMLDEVAFIESRQERGLPHARFEMKTRKWNPEAEACCSVEPSSLVQSVDEPHCTICFCELEDGDRVGDLGCKHVFHADCLKLWVTKRNACPLCNIPIARRERISSDELVKISNTAEAESVLSLTSTILVPSTTTNNNNNSSPDYDHTLPTVEGYNYGSPSNQQRNGPRRLTHMPMTPSTVGADTYSNYSEEEFDELEAVDLSREGFSPTPSDREMDDSSPATAAGAAATPNNHSSMAATTRAAERIDRMSEVQEVDDGSDHRCSNNNHLLTTTSPVASLDAMGCNINDFLERGTRERSLSQSDDSSDMDIPSPPSRIHRLADGHRYSTFVSMDGIHCFECGSKECLEEKKKHEFNTDLSLAGDNASSSPCSESPPEQDEPVKKKQDEE